MTTYVAYFMQELSEMETFEREFDRLPDSHKHDYLAAFLGAIEPGDMREYHHSIDAYGERAEYVGDYYAVVFHPLWVVIYYIDS